MKIKIAAVSYLNTKPFLFGLEHSPVKSKIETGTYIPSVIADMLLNNRADVGLIPVAAIPQLQHAQIITDYCIGSIGEVGSVLILSDVPLENIQSVYLDYQSRTSVALARILLKNFWKKNVEYLKAESGYETGIAGNVAGVVIGDRALSLRRRFNFVYDLGEAWYNYTSLPFVYACWVANKHLDKDFITQFNDACKYGVENIDLVADQLQKEENFFPGSKNYLTNCISYNLDDDKRKGLEMFLRLIEGHVPLY